MTLKFSHFAFQEFIPRGRSIISEHPGPLSTKNDNVPTEFVLLDRMQNVNLSKDFNERWSLREVYEPTSIPNLSEELAFLSPATVNSEEELYYRGSTAVWSKGLFNTDHEKASSEICYTTESPIQFAFFCTRNFLNADFKVETKTTKRSESEDNPAIGLIDSGSLKVYSTNGENLVTAIESPISKIWSTNNCLIVEKEASATMFDGHRLAMPRVFSLIHPLNDMSPVLIKSNLLVSYITEAEYQVRLISFSLHTHRTD